MKRPAISPGWYLFPADLPGGSGFRHLFRGHSREGILLLFIFILFLTQVLLWAGQLPIHGPSFHPLSTLGIHPGILFLLFYGLVQYRMKQILFSEGSPIFEGRKNGKDGGLTGP